MHGNGQGNLRGNVHGNVQGQGNVQAQSNVNAKFNGNADLNLNFGFRRTNAKQNRNTVFVPINDLPNKENLRSFGYRKRYAIYCMRNNIYE